MSSADYFKFLTEVVKFMFNKNLGVVGRSQGMAFRSLLALQYIQNQKMTFSHMESGAMLLLSSLSILF